MDENKVRQLISEELRKQLGSSLFPVRKLTDTPTDDLQVTSRKYVNLYGTTRPVSSVVGQHFLDMNLASGRGKPIQYNGTGWTDATGTYV